MTRLRTLADRANYWSRRSVKYFRQRVSGRGSSPNAAFIVGCQRSGTNMIADVLDKSPEVWVYGEANRRAFDNYRIRPHAVRERLISAATCRRVIFKPICDSQHTDRLLDEHPGSKAVWVYRRYQDVANSAVSKWGDDVQVGHIRIAATQPDSGHWFVDRLSPELRQLAAELYDDRMTPSTGGALKWYFRNKIYIDLALDKQSDRVLLVRYEDLVTDPDMGFQRVYDFLGLTFDREHYAEVFGSSVGKARFPEIDPRVEALCTELTGRLDAAYMDGQGGSVSEYADVPASLIL